MLKPSHDHEQLISLQRLSLEGHELRFGQAFLSQQVDGGSTTWVCVLRGISAEQLGCLAGEVPLVARTLDGRRIEGRVLIPQSMLASAEAQQSLELDGVGPMLVDGRKI
jgi:hypothetical protein